jgi:hypothetical protein
MPVRNVIVQNQLACMMASMLLSACGTAHALASCRLASSMNDIWLHAAGSVQQVASATFNSTSQGVELPDPFSASAFEAMSMATWQIFYGTDSDVEPCMTVKAQANTKLCLQCAPAATSMAADAFAGLLTLL